jgi:hypothetical protein
MARDEELREDLLREATALVVRIELEIDGIDDEIVAGFRRDGAASFYFGQQISYQFNTAGKLRRGYLDGRLYKPEAGRLVQLTRRRTAKEVELVRHECNAVEEQEFLTTAGRRLFALQHALTESQFHVLGQFPPDADIGERVRSFLTELPKPIALACSPNLI